MTKHSYLNSTHYRQWVLARDKALERLHINAQLEATDEMRNILTQVLLTAKSHYYAIKNPMHAHSIDQLDKQIKDTMRMGGDRLFQIYSLLRVRSYILAKSSETEIVAQLNPGKHIANRIAHDILLKKQGQESFAGGPAFHRIQMYMDRLGRQIINRAQSSALLAKDEYEFMLDIVLSFPRRKVYKRPPRVLNPKLMTEADQPTKIDVAVDHIDDNAWADMVDAYKDEYIPKWRAPEYIVDIPVTDPTITATDEEVWYAWEFERDLTNEFVKSVRDGQIDGAKEAGITDFVWVAVIDSATDACCRWRDGLLVSEIEKQLGEHRDEDGECDIEVDGLNPPLHFNCRCTLAPATDNIPAVPGTDTKDFDEWLDAA